MRYLGLIPVELNAIIACNMRYFAYFYELLGDSAAAQKYRIQYEVCWRTGEMKVATTLNILAFRLCVKRFTKFSGMRLMAAGSTTTSSVRRIRSFLYVSFLSAFIQQFNVFCFQHDTNIFPLYAGCTHDGFDGARIVEYLTSSGVLNHPGGIPTSLLQSGQVRIFCLKQTYANIFLIIFQQWDFPSGWAPTNYIIIIGLLNAGQTEIARVLADRWLRRNYTIYVKSGGNM